MASKDYMLEHLEDYVVESSNGWYYYDETMAQLFGPYESKEECLEFFNDFLDNFI
jgi:hypothetical protein